MTHAELKHWLYEVHANVQAHTPEDAAVVIIVAHKRVEDGDCYVTGPPLVATNLPIETTTHLIRLLSTAKAVVRPRSNPS